MASERLAWQPSAVATAMALRSLIPAPASVAQEVAEIVAAVRDGGDPALLEFVTRFDTGGSDPPPLVVRADELERAHAQLEQPVREGLKRAFENVLTTARAGIAVSGGGVVGEDAEIVLREEPVERAAVYVPAGRAPYPSTVVMASAAARAAGVGEIIVCSPPSADGDIDTLILGACHLAGVQEVYRMGGAHSIAALAHGTETVTPVDVIVGPGSLYVQEAKRQVSDRVGIDGFAGPSDLLVIVEQDAGEADAIALDLLAQAEHGEGSLVVAASTSEVVLADLERRLEGAPETGAVIRLVQVPDVGEALRLIQALAPEHLQLAGEGPEGLAPRVTRAGCVFVGAASGTAFGDYIAGSNHILPTNGSARFASALSAASFRRRFTEVHVRRPAELARAAAPIARAEGFELHARSMEARIRENRS